MDVFFIVVGYILVANIAFVLGFMASYVIRRNKSYFGTIKIIPDEGKLIYSLELDENPIMLKDKSEVIFKIETSD